MSSFKGLRILVSAGFQTLAIQLLGVAFFYLVSLYLNKDLFGVLSWCNAVVVTLNMVLSLGMEQVVLRRVAAGNRRSDWAAGAYFAHAGLSSLLMFLFLALLAYLVPGNTKIHYLPLLFAAQSAIFTATPLKQLLNAQERFTPYAVIALLANTLKIVLVMVAIGQGNLSLTQVSYILLACGLLELLSAFAYTWRYAAFRIRFRLLAYRKLVQEALPQFVFILFDSSFSRLDWILMGLLCTDAATAEYSFAYRAFELARMPSVIQGMVLMPRAARLMQKDGRLDPAAAARLSSLAGVILFAAILMAGTISMLWAPVVDFLTAGKYGSVNTWVFLLLTCCIPMHMAINIWWTFAFSARRYRQITGISILVTLVNLGANLVLIPLFQGLGAAMALVLATTLQAFCFMRLAAGVGVSIPVFRGLLLYLLMGLLFAGLSFTGTGIVLKVLLLATGFTGIALTTGMVKPASFLVLKKALHR